MLCEFASLFLYWLVVGSLSAFLGSHICNNSIAYENENRHCMETAQYLRDKITEAGLTCRLNDLSCTVVLERPMDDKFIKRWQLACEEDIAHVVVMPNVTKTKIDKFVEELVECKDEYGRMKPMRKDGPLMKLQSTSWGGSYVAPTVSDFKEDF